MMRLATKGRKMSKVDAQLWVYAELDRMYPPSEKGTMPPDGGEPDKGTISPGGQIQGLGDIPGGWVQANRLRIVEERAAGATVVRLDLSGSPAP